MARQVQVRLGLLLRRAEVHQAELDFRLRAQGKGQEFERRRRHRKPALRPVLCFLIAHSIRILNQHGSCEPRSHLAPGDHWYVIHIGLPRPSPRPPARRARSSNWSCPSARRVPPGEIHRLLLRLDVRVDVLVVLDDVHLGELRRARQLHRNDGGADVRELLAHEVVARSARRPGCCPSRRRRAACGTPPSRLAGGVVTSRLQYDMCVEM